MADATITVALDKYIDLVLALTKLIHENDEFRNTQFRSPRRFGPGDAEPADVEYVKDDDGDVYRRLSPNKWRRRINPDTWGHIQWNWYEITLFGAVELLDFNPEESAS